jgi:hypothetical protein
MIAQRDSPYLFAARRWQVSYSRELQDVIRQVYGVESKYLESVPVRETFQGRTIWDGIVEVFELKRHPSASKVYVFEQETDDPDNPHRYVTALHQPSIRSAREAVKAAIVQELGNPKIREES